MESVKLAYFSPTGTTKAVVEAIASGINPNTIKHNDITKPEARKQALLTSENEVLVVAVPVYMGRVPALLTDWLNAIEGQDTPTVCVVVYGNRVYDDALLELKNSVMSRGCVPVACAAFIGEHSFSDSALPTAQGRPDADDLKHAKVLGQKIRKKLESVASISQLSDVPVSGHSPYGGATELWDVDFIAVDNQCTQCGVCAAVCPVDAVDPQKSTAINHEKCITCCACIKRCPENARTIKTGPVKDAQKRLNTLFHEPKKPECFL